MQPAPAPLRVCPGCGAIAPIQRTSCAGCNTAFGPTPLVAFGGVGTAVFARIYESDFECRGCGLRGPVTLSFDAEAECRRCGLRQVFPPSQWGTALDSAHSVADLTGPDDEGRFRDNSASIAAVNPHKTVGVEHTRAIFQQNTTIIDGGGMKRLTLRVVAGGDGDELRRHADLALGLAALDAANRTSKPPTPPSAVSGGLRIAVYGPSAPRAPLRVDLRPSWDTLARGASHKGRVATQSHRKVVPLGRRDEHRRARHLYAMAALVGPVSGKISVRENPAQRHQPSYCAAV